MKFLEDEALIALTQELTDVICGNRVINGRIEAWSCKRAGTDKKFAQSLAEKILNDAETLPKNSKMRKKSPLGDLNEMSTRRLMTDLILTLNASFPDYDFSSAHPDHFINIPSASEAIYLANTKLSELVVATGKDPSFLTYLWNVIDEIVLLRECQVFSYNPPDNDEFLNTLTDGGEAICSTDALWSFNYFFVNKSLKRIVLFTCVQSYLMNDEEIEERFEFDENQSFIYASQDMGMDFSVAMT